MKQTKNVASSVPTETATDPSGLAKNVPSRGDDGQFPTQSQTVPLTASGTNVNKEIISVLRELSQNQTRNNEKLEQMNTRVNTLCDQMEPVDYEYDEYAYQYHDENEDESLSIEGRDSVNFPNVIGNESYSVLISEEPPCKRVKGDSFKHLTDKFQTSEKVE